MRKERVPTSGGKVPVRPMKEKFKLVTRLCFTLQIMPTQLQTDVVSDQLFVIRPKGSFVMWALRARRAALSVVMFWAKAMKIVAIKMHEKKAREEKKFLSMVLEELMIFKCLYVILIYNSHLIVLCYENCCLRNSCQNLDCIFILPCDQWNLFI